MQLRSAFRLPVPVNEAWSVVEDVGRLARCLPNVTDLTVDGDRCAGALAMTVGPLRLTLHGTARVVSRNRDLHVVTIDAVGAQSARMHAAAQIYVQLLDHHDETIVTVVTDLEADGPVARLGHGPLTMANDRFWRAFGERLATQLRPGVATPHTATPSGPTLAVLTGTVGRFGSVLRGVRTAIS